MLSPCEKSTRAVGKDIQEHRGEGNISKEACNKEVTLGGELWTDGYYVGTVGERGNWTVVEDYIVKQEEPKEEHRQMGLFK